ncbi:MAG: HAD family hydrolase [Myxococcales bacterium]|nr:HAD family hydrolase [Myxococcales bacterium]MCB9712440.1 HAD family hydrolase [Myxococcales bacterium]
MRTGADARALLQQVLDRCGAPHAVAVFDLDSTLLDNKTRQARIMAEYGERHGVAALARSRAEHWEGWDYRVAMRNAGLPPDQVEAHVEPYRALWRELFFTSEYCRLDTPVRGSVAYMQAVRETGARICYVTGRHEAMRAGSEDCFAQHGLPEPDGDRVQLWMKPTLEEHDDDYKARVHADLPGLGTVVAVFDNEPMHVNDYRRSFPEALVVHLATDHSMRDTLVDPGIPSIADFGSWS